MVAKAIGDEAFVNLLLSASGLHKRLELERVDPAFGAFWQTIARALPGARVVAIATGGHGTLPPFASGPRTRSSPPLDIGVHLVDPRVRADWFRLRGDTSIRVLSLGDVAIALRSSGLRMSTSSKPAGAYSPAASTRA